MSQLTRKDLEEVIDRKLGVFVEHIDDKIDALAEAIQVMNSTMSIMVRDSDLLEVKQDVKIIKTAVKETNNDLHRLENSLIT